MSNDKATPRPWRVDEGNLIFGADYGNLIFGADYGHLIFGADYSGVGDTCVSADDYDTQMANAALIVKAVNMHDRLVEALKAVRGHQWYCLSLEKDKNEPCSCGASKIEALISEAEGE